MARLLYSLVIYLATPLILLRLLWRARKQPEYLQHLGERWGFYRTPVPPKTIWVHAVSVGETRAAQPLIEALQSAWPQHRILLTGMTPTGRAAGSEVYGGQVTQAYLPYDYPAAVDRFFSHFSPDFGVLMETEIWPNLLAGARAPDSRDSRQRPAVGTFGAWLQSAAGTRGAGICRARCGRRADAGRC